MIFKDGVNPFGIKPELLAGLMVAESVWRDNGHTLTVTSLNDSKHSNTSLHYAGYAADLRTRYFESKEMIETIANELRYRLGSNPDYDVVVENTHIHLEYQPKRRT